LKIFLRIRPGSQWKWDWNSPARWNHNIL